MRLVVILGIVCRVVSVAAPVSAQELETETARVPPSGTLEVGAGFEYQTSSEGKESALPTVVELGLFDRLELVIEPVAYTAIRPNVGPHATGAGDLEVTLLGLAWPEGEWRPAIAFAGEVKLPTAGNSLIGTGQTDWTAYLILSKHLADGWDAHLDLSYAVQGQPPGPPVGDLLGFAAAVVYKHDNSLHFFAEMLGNVSTVDGEGADSSTGAQAEVGGGELVGTLGAGYWVTSALLVSLGVSYDNSGAFIVHPGLLARANVF